MVPKLTTLNRGEARNLLRGQKRWSGDGSPQRSPGAEPRWGRGLSPQKPETNANFQLRRGTCTQVLPLGYATDLGWPWTADTHSITENMLLSEPTTKIWMKIDPYYRQQKCRPMTVVSGAIRLMRIFAEVPLGTSNDDGVIDNGNFQRFRWLFFSETLEMRPVLL